MNDNPLVLPRRLAIRLLHEAQISPEAEVCGLVGADGSGPVSVYPIANVAPHTARRFEMDPHGQIAAMRHMREKGETLWAIYHSHPAAPATPSPRDLAGSGHPGVLYLIVSLNTKGVLEIRCWDYAEGAVHERALRIKD